MKEGLKTAILNHVKQKFGRDDLDLRIEITEDGRPYIVLTIDCMKMDKNSGKFDQSYFNFVTNAHREKPKGFLLDFRSSVFTPIINDFKKFMNIDLNHWFNYKNYDYIDDIETTIEDAIKISSHPEIEIDFSGPGDSPKLLLGFFNLNPKLMDDKDAFDFFIKKLNKSTGLDLEQYRISKTMGKRSR